ncbi:hypothetical protein [Kitasatospora sp. NBC_00458]|uniref:hypothetical protein n=1 Tax=Kitasatospora sp. NBC_00458 TaxID=2903568 RepID=UPI002E18EE39
MSTDPRRAAYQAGHALAGHLLTVLTPLPARIQVSCPTWSPDQPTINLYAHLDLAALKSWAETIGGDLVPQRHEGERVHWILTAEVDGILVEGWTITDPPNVGQ